MVALLLHGLQCALLGANDIGNVPWDFHDSCDPGPSSLKIFKHRKNLGILAIEALQYFPKSRHPAAHRLNMVEVHRETRC